MSSIVFKYFPDLSATQQEQISQLKELYIFWNNQINVVSRKDIDELYERHVLHSLGIAKVIQFKPGTTILDIGTGGGFPGIPLAILFPEVQFHLVDAIGKKIKVVDEVSKGIGLQNLTCEHQRAEKVKGEYDFIVSRAVTRMASFMLWTKGKIKKDSNNSLKNGIVALKGGDLAEELSEIRNKSTLYNLSDYFEEEFFETKKVVHIPFH
jgi:16S rRNA (guanine527-N7)-methyltransferase